MSIIRRTLLTLIVVLAGMLFFQAPASAEQHYAAKGWYGGVTPYKVSHYDVRTGLTSPVLPGLLVGGPVVTRSNGSVGAQKVAVIYVLTRYHANGFRSEESFIEWYSIASNVTQVKLPDFHRSAGATGGTFNVRFSLTWYDSVDRWLGTRSVNYNGSTTDYSCTYSHYVKCWVNTGSITIS